jgi:CBS domain-containing protein
MTEEGTRHLVVASSGSDLIAGTVSDLDLLRAVVEGREDAMASDVMRMEAPATIAAHESLRAAAARMTEEGHELLVVMDGQPSRPVGTLAAGDLVAFLAGR